MSSLADLPDLAGFFSYARLDNAHMDADLSLLRRRVRDELRGRLGRELRLWQDTDAIPHGAKWRGQIIKAIAESAFFIPIVSPSLLNSRFCREEFDAFLARERELGRDDLVFPILYIPVSGRANAGRRGQEDVLQIINARQYLDWTDMRLKDAGSVEVRTAVARFCGDIVGALQKRWEPPEARKTGAGRPALPGDAATPPGSNVSQTVTVSGTDNVSRQVSGGSNVINISRSDASPQPGAPEGGVEGGRVAGASADASARKREWVRDPAMMLAFVSLIVGALSFADARLLKTLGPILSVGGLALGVFFLLFRDLVRKSIFPTLRKDDAYRLLRLIAVLIWSIAIVGIGAWVWGELRASVPPAPAPISVAPANQTISETEEEARLKPSENSNVTNLVACVNNARQNNNKTTMSDYESYKCEGPVAQRLAARPDACPDGSKPAPDKIERKSKSLEDGLYLAMTWRTDTCAGRCEVRFYNSQDKDTTYQCEVRIHREDSKSTGNNRTGAKGRISSPPREYPW